MNIARASAKLPKLFKLLKSLWMLVFALHWACSLEPPSAQLGSVDVHPPVLEESQGFDDYFVLRFDESLHSVRFLQIWPELPFDAGRSAVFGQRWRVQLRGKTVPGQPYLLRAEADDAAGNMRKFMVRVYGTNLNPADLLINEINPKGTKSGNNPEVIEFYVRKGGNIGGLTLVYSGYLPKYSGRFVFPPMDVATGDFILLHTRWDAAHKKDRRKINETQGKKQAKARLTSDSAWDFWADEISGLSDTRAALALYVSPGKDARLLDAMVYAASASRNKRGWGSSFLMGRIDDISAAKGWLGRAKELVPGDAVASKKSTATRSISRLHRSGQPVDTNTAADWIVVQNSKYSFGRHNSLAKYP